jgi:hypothetical protein
MESDAMTPIPVSPRRTPVHAATELLVAAQIVRDAAEVLADEARDASQSGRYLLAADRLNMQLGSLRVARRRLILASPALIERSGRTRSLVEMIEAELSDDDYRLRLAKLLFRALIWRPETFPMPDP